MGIRKDIKQVIKDMKQALEIPATNEREEGFVTALKLTVSELENILENNPKEKK